METGGNKKVFCLICTCMERNSGLVAHAVSFCSTVFVLALKNNDLSSPLHHASWINDNKIQTYSGSGRIKTPLPSLSNWHFSPSFPLSADARCCTEPLSASNDCSNVILLLESLRANLTDWPRNIYWSFFCICTFSHFLSTSKKGNNP